MLTKYMIEDKILTELRHMRGFIKVDDADVSRVRFDGMIDIGRLAEMLCELIPADKY